MIKKKSQEKTLSEVMREYKAVFSIELFQGFANVSFDDKGDMIVEFFDEDGGLNEGGEFKYGDIKKVTKFIEAMKELRLNDYQTLS